MNYTPLPESTEAPMAFSAVDNGVSRKGLIIGSVVLLLLVFSVLAFTIFKPQKSPPTINKLVLKPTPTIFFDYPPSPFPTEEIISLKPPLSSTNEAELSPTYAQIDPKNTSKIESDTSSNNNFPRLPEAGIPIPILVVAFLSGFIILVGFVL